MPVFRGAPPDFLVLGTFWPTMLQNLGKEGKIKAFVVKCERTIPGNSTEKRGRVQPCSEAPELKWDMGRKSRLFGR